MAKVVKFENVTITGLTIENVTMKTREQRVKEVITFADAQLQAYGAEAWGQDKVQQLALRQGETVTIVCALQPRMFGGNIIYSLQAFAVERPTQETEQPAAQTQEADTDPFA